MDLGFELPPDSPLWNIPAMSPPPGVKSNFINPQTLSGPIEVLNGLFVALAIIALSLRLYARAISSGTQRTGWDDAFCIVAMLGSIAHTVLLYLSIESGYGRHLYDIRAFSLTPMKLRIKTLVDEVYIIALLSIKISILIMYWRIFKIYKSSKRLIIFGFVANITVSIPYLAVAVSRTIRCNGIRALNVKLCMSRSVSTTVVVFGVFNTLLDFYTLLIPINRVHHMKIAKRTRLGLLAIFMTGLVACLMSAVRLIITAIKFNDGDVFWTAATISPYTIVEINLAIICPCMMFLPQVVRKVKGERSTLSGKSSAKSSSAKSSHNVPTIGGGGYYRMNQPPASSKGEVKTWPNDRGIQYMDSWERSMPDLAFLTDEDQHEALTALPRPPQAHFN